MATYYVATTGDNLNPGTELLPWGDIDGANGVALPGDVVLVRGGTYNKHDREPISVGTSTGDDVIFRAYPGEVPYLRTTETVTGFTSTPTEGEWSAPLAAFEGNAYGDSAAVWKDGVNLIEGSAAGALNTDEMFYDSSDETLYVQEDDDFSEGSVEVSRAAIVRFSGSGNVKFDGLVFEYGYKGIGRMSLYGDDAHDGDTTLFRCVIKDTFTNGIQPMEKYWDVRECHFQQIGPTGGPNNFAYAFYTGSDCLGGFWKGNTFIDVLSYCWHIYPSGIGTEGHTVEDNLWTGLTTSGVIVCQDGTAVLIKNNVFYATLASTTTGPVQCFGTVLRSEGNVVQGNKMMNMLGWNLEDGTTDFINTFIDNKIWDSGYYSDDNHDGALHSGTEWCYTVGMKNAIRFAHNGVGVGNLNILYTTARAAWDDNAPWVVYTDPGNNKPTEASFWTSHLARYPDHAYHRLNDPDRVYRRSIVPTSQIITSSQTIDPLYKPRAVND